MKTRLKEIRQNVGLSQTEFAEKLAISRSALAKIESGENNPSEQTIVLVCERFGINRQWLETGEGERLKLQEVSSLIPRLQRIFSSYPTIAHTLETALAVMKDEDFQRLSEIIEECKKNARG